MNFVTILYQHIALFNPLQVILGLSLAPHIEAAVEYLKANWRLPGQLAPYAASILAFVIQVAIIWIFRLPLSTALISAVFTTAGACFWHELSTQQQK